MRRLNFCQDACLKQEKEKPMSQVVYYSRLEIKNWSFYLAATETGLCFVGSSPADKEELVQWVEKIYPEGILKEEETILSSYKEQFSEYLLGERQLFTLPTDTVGTSFQKQVWRELQKIPYGKTKTYGEIAEAIGKPTGSARAVGTAVGKNPLLIICPCHRVVPRSGNPRGFRGGLNMKQQLLALENPVYA